LKSKEYTLSEIRIYPVKSLPGISLSSSIVLPKGLQYDRRYMLVTADNTAMTQRDYPKMALFKVKIVEPFIKIELDGESCSIPLTPDTYSGIESATVWDDSVNTWHISAEYSHWFSEKIGVECKLLYFPETNTRKVDPTFTSRDENVSLADAFPILILGEESLNELNGRLKDKITMDRFRPNLIFSGGNAFDEDRWRDFSIASNTFAAVKPCARCILITNDPETGMRGPEPLRTLAKYRSRNNKVYFGQNVLVMNATNISVGDPIIVTSFREDQN
jgi:uncharacterized protein